MFGPFGGPLACQRIGRSLGGDKCGVSGVYAELSANGGDVDDFPSPAEMVHCFGNCPVGGFLLGEIGSMARGSDPASLMRLQVLVSPARVDPIPPLPPGMMATLPSSVNKSFGLTSRPFRAGPVACRARR